MWLMVEPLDVPSIPPLSLPCLKHAAAPHKQHQLILPGESSDLQVYNSLSLAACFHHDSLTIFSSSVPLLTIVDIHSGEPAWGACCDNTYPTTPRRAIKSSASSIREASYLQEEQAEIERPTAGCLILRAEMINRGDIPFPSPGIGTTWN
jgi:hypothetical protein